MRERGLLRRTYALLLLLYPPVFRRRYGADMQEFFADEIERARRISGRGGVAALCVRAALDVVIQATRAWREAWWSRGPHAVAASRVTQSEGSSLMEGVLQDVRYAVRSLMQRPAFSVIALATLALGIGASSAMFAVVRAVLFEPLPYRDPGRVVRVAGASAEAAGRVSNLSRPDFLDLARENRTLESMGAYSAGIGSFAIVEGEPERVRAVNVSAGFFRVLGVPPLAGRLFNVQDEEEGVDVVLISHGLWQRRFASDPGVVGRTIVLGAGPQVIVGILPAAFRYPQPDLLGDPDIYAPMRFGQQFARSGRSIRAIGRLRPDASIEQAQADLRALAGRLEQQYPRDNHRQSVRVERLLDTIVGQARTGLVILFAAVGSILLVACVNITNLLIARGTSRERELAIRSALGASRTRIVRQLITETVVLAVASGVCGLLLGAGTLRLVLAIAAGSIPRADDVTFDATIVMFGVGLALLSGVAVGAVASGHATRAGIVTALGGGTRGGASTPLGSRLRAALIAAEVATSLVLVIGAALLLQSLWRLSNVSVGFTRQQVLSVDVALSLRRHPEGAQIPFYQELYQRIGRLPGVRGVAATNILPLSGGYSCDGFRIDRQPVQRGLEPCAEVRSISPRFFEVMAIPIVAGRGFTDDDQAGGHPVVVINQAMARTFWPGQNPVGQTMTYFSRGDRLGPREIVGVVGDTKHLSLTEEPRSIFYTPQPQPPSFHGMTLVIRGDADRVALVSAIRHEIRQMDPTIALHNARTIEEILGRAVAEPRFRSVLLGLFAAVALGLALMGVYGVIVYLVTQRTREIGIRMALGAGRRAVVRMIVRQALTPVLWGLAAGVVLAGFSTQVLSTLLYGVSPSDPLTLAIVPIGVFAVALAAAVIPALRASRVDPISAMRGE
jgi:putative ABC transport system permease protein